MKANAFWLLVVSLALVGCPDRDRVQAPDDPDTPRETRLPELPGEVTLQVTDWQEIEQAIAEQRGKVVVVDFWSTWCDPCVREFPNLVKLQRMHLDDVVCMSVSLNYDGLDPEPTEETKAEVLEFLERQGAKFPNFLSSVPDEELYEKLAIPAIPAVFVYNQQGELHRFVVEDIDAGDFTYEDDIIPLVEQLLSAR